MNITKALEVAAEYRAEGKKLLALADDIEAAARKAGDEALSRTTVAPEEPVAPSRARNWNWSKATGYLAVSVEVLREAGQPMHIEDMVPKIGEKMHKDVSRANVEGALVRGIKLGKVKRPQPGTYALP